jgi:hypothetical protein
VYPIPKFPTEMSIEQHGELTGRDDLRSFDLDDERAEVSKRTIQATYCSGSIYTSADGFSLSHLDVPRILTLVIYSDLTAFHELWWVFPVEWLPVVLVFRPASQHFNKHYHPCHLQDPLVVLVAHARPNLGEGDKPGR